MSVPTITGKRQSFSSFRKNSSPFALVKLRFKDDHSFTVGFVLSAFLS